FDGNKRKIADGNRFKNLPKDLFRHDGMFTEMDLRVYLADKQLVSATKVRVIGHGYEDVDHPIVLDQYGICRCGVNVASIREYTVISEDEYPEYDDQGQV